MLEGDPAREAPRCTRRRWMYERLSGDRIVGEEMIVASFELRVSGLFSMESAITARAANAVTAGLVYVAMADSWVGRWRFGGYLGSVILHLLIVTRMPHRHPPHAEVVAFWTS